MKQQTEQYKQSTQQQAAGLVMSAAAGKVYAAIVRRRGDTVERTHQAVYELSEGLDVAVRQILQQAGDPQIPVVIGLDSARLRFLEITLPPADAAQLPLLIRTQAEAQLPLDGDRMQLAWRLSPSEQGFECTVAAARLDATDTALGKLSLNGRLTALVPDAAGFAELRQRFFEPTPEVCIALRRRPDGFVLILLDGPTSARCAVIHADATDIAERPALVMQDIRMELETLQQREGQRLPIYLWPAGDPFMQQVASSLTQAGWTAGSLEADRAALTRAGLDAADDLNGPSFDAAGLAMLGLTGKASAFDFLQTHRLAQPAEDAKRRKTRLIRAVWLMAAMALLCAAVGYWSMTLHVRQLRQELAAEVDGLKAETLLQRQTYQEAAARARIDLIELVEAIQDSRDGMLLDSIEFEKGKPVKLIATAGGYEQVYTFQKKLQAQNGVSQIRLIDPRLDERTRQVRFTMQFQYKHYTK